MDDSLFVRCTERFEQRYHHFTGRAQIERAQAFNPGRQALASEILHHQIGLPILGIPHVSMVIKQEIKDSRLTCERTVEGGTLIIEADLPALFTTQRGINEPRYASLPGIMKAKKKPLEKKTLEDIGLDPSEVGSSGAKCKVEKLSFPPERVPGKIIEGETPEAVAAELVRLLREEAKVI